MARVLLATPAEVQTERLEPEKEGGRVPGTASMGWMLILLVGSGRLAELPAQAQDGNAVCVRSCAACHATGAAGAPRLDDRTAWAGRLHVGANGLLASVLKGKGAMPPKGGNANRPNAEVDATVRYMMSVLGP